MTGRTPENFFAVCKESNQFHVMWLAHSVSSRNSRLQWLLAAAHKALPASWCWNRRDVLWGITWSIFDQLPINWQTRSNTHPLTLLFFPFHLIEIRKLELRKADEQKIKIKIWHLEKCCPICPSCLNCSWLRFILLFIVFCLKKLLFFELYFNFKIPNFLRQKK